MMDDDATPSPDGTDAERGQATVDYAIGMGVFLVAIVFVFGFAPSIFAPFTVDTDSTTVLADRSADRLSADLLVDDPTDPAELNRTCTEGFFDADGSAPAGCRYDDTTDGANLTDSLGLASTANVNVTLRRGGTLASLDGTPLAVGDSPAGNSDILVARRLVSIGTDEYRLLLRMW